MPVCFVAFMRWLQLRFDFDSTAVRLLIKNRQDDKIAPGPSGCSDVMHRHPLARYPRSRRPSYPGRSAYGGNERRRMVAARSNCGRMGVEGGCVAVESINYAICNDDLTIWTVAFLITDCPKTCQLE